MKYKKISVNLISASIIVTSIFQSFPLNQVQAAPKADTAVSTCVNSDMAALAFEQDDQVDSAQPSEILTGLTPDVDYKEGSVILMMKEGKGDARLGGVRGDLLSDAEELADVTRVVDEDEQLIEEMTGEEAALGSEDRVTLSLIESDEYTTAQLLDMYKDAPGVLEALPDYISHIDGEGSFMDDDVFEEGIPDDDVKKGVAVEDCLTEETEPVFTADAPTESVLGTDENTDLTSYQFLADDLPGGMDVPGWNDPANKNAEGTVVAVLDTGVDYEHPDLKSVMWDEGETYPALVAKGGGKYGYCALENEETEDAYDSRDPMDENGHGTHCAGIIGALWDEKGVSGLANGVRIMAVRVGDKNGSMSDSTIIRGFEYII
ncbi:MAG: S8 family serine peptidase, partial [Lachnospiraceae bacterium]|nr:S8 family serine peptidase [Lachnospiraceae bacterium]